MAKRMGMEKIMLNLAIIFSILNNNLTLQVKILDVKNILSEDVDL